MRLGRRLASLRCGLGVLIAALAAIAVISALDQHPDARVALAVAVAPAAATLIGVVLLVRALPRLAREGRIRALSLRLREALTEEFAVIPGYVPRDSGDGAIDVVVVGPTGVYAVEVCEVSGLVTCHDDVRHRRHGTAARRLATSPSDAARRNATRLRLDARSGGLVRTSVESIVVFTHAQIAEVSGCSASLAQGVDALADQVRRWNRAPLSCQRARAIARALSGTLSVAS